MDDRDPKPETGAESAEQDAPEQASPAATEPPPRRRRRRWLLLVALPLVLLLGWYGGGAFSVHVIDDDPAFAESIEVEPGGSRAVAVAAALIEREVMRHRWVANDPWFMPGAVLDNMPAYQQGIVYALSRFAIELTDRLARVRGSSQIDPDADEAAGRLKYPGDVWIFEWSSTPVQPSSESQYRKALEALRRYNARLAQGQAVFDRRADNLRDTLDRFASDLGSASAAIDEQIRIGATTLVDFGADDLFYANKGRLYAYALLLRALGEDFRELINERNLARAWEQMLAAMTEAAALDPWWVTNGALDSPALPNHLAAQGFLLLRARTQLREIVDILQK